MVSTNIIYLNFTLKDISYLNLLVWTLDLF